MIGLTCAVNEEFQAAVKCLAEPVERKRSGEFEMAMGTLGSVPVVVIRHGTGKVAAAAAAQLAIERYHPRALINFGAAGSLVDDLRVGDVVVAEKLYQGDLGVVHGEGFRHTGAACHHGDEAVFVREYEADPSLIGAARKVAREMSPLDGGASIQFGPVVSCDQVILSREFREELRGRFGAIAVEMEGASVAHVASMNRCGFLVVRSVSDAVDLDIVGLEEVIRYSGESGAACWSRRAKFVALHPGAIEKMRSLSGGLKIASRNAARVACSVARKFGETREDMPGR
ncbi:MAG: 5'-methylthioadenosine/S-adenosylhomocysteine nucleosidase [Actinobacteria bacterium]|nr:5'-methylthioadenosine/S-adenosylhomocysteine nucleosidase [Actinomycetota bacterium]MCG2818213.1 5'-methylthioadenosine/S-adenosylhomocysteine nucleosidase [Actinomycetes bacterium]MBU4179536.1 5'-methylthioadenosine/S-adenosylhomocysteine nucleosidase [Actinomycetota bacterium]MBU4219610.1 5'-methylthioadenosine/S-adenosylhomocysteine nucleosidase [Actinomycetota bacterium]MBU4358451.1 5'-methylthioadenosine/S-adenosylhomocysteine nucleosidase [Actinomycetota bacterium]